MTVGMLPDALITRCAWCDRYEVGGRWLAKEHVAAFLRDDGSTVTHGICPDCVADLKRRKMTAKLVSRRTGNLCRNARGRAVARA
jgi:hypothetical protein